MDWTNTKRRDRFVYEMVDPNNLEASRGYLEGVVDATITHGYYTDTRTSGSMNAYAVKDQWVENSLIRIHHFVDEENYHNELCTCFVSEIEEGWSNSTDDFDITLKSMLWKLEDDALTSNLTLPKGSYSKAALQKVFGMCGASYTIAPDTVNHQYTAPVVYEAGTSLLSVCYQICDSMSARMDVNGHGTITINRYIAPSSRTEQGIINEDMIYGRITKMSNFYSMPNRALVVYTNGDKVITGYADLSSTNPMSFGRRGRRVVEVHQESDLNPANSSKASSKAREYLDNNSSITTYEMNTLYIPVSAGDVYNIRFDETDHKCMLQTRDLKIAQTITCSDTWRAV